LCEKEKEDASVDEETQKRAIMLLSTGIAAILASRLSDRFIDVPEERGIKDDVKEALLKAGFSLASTIIASVIIRRVVSTRWGA
jgi:hypothetical protein